MRYLRKGGIFFALTMNQVGDRFLVKKMVAFAYSLSGYTHPTIQLFKLSVFHPHIDLCHVLIHNKRHKEQNIPTAIASTYADSNPKCNTRAFAFRIPHLNIVKVVGVCQNVIFKVLVQNFNVQFRTLLSKHIGGYASMQKSIILKQYPSL